MRSGEHVDPAVVWIIDRPPVGVPADRVMLYRGVDAVGPSRYALPLDVRRATVSASEVSMGFAPTRVVATNGTPFVLHWATSVFNQDNITGSEIRLSAKPFRKDEPITIAKTDFTHAACFFADWFDGAEDMTSAPRENRPFSRIRAVWNRPS